MNLTHLTYPIIGMAQDIKSVGLTKREYIATAAMPAVVTLFLAHNAHHQDWKAVAKGCVELADALLAELAD